MPFASRHSSLVTVLLLLALLQIPDTAVFANPATRDLIGRAIARHGHDDQSVRDYAARFRYRLSFGLGRRRWAMVPNAAIEEQDGRVQWAHPNDLRVEIIGRRAASRAGLPRISSSFDRPWFVPRTLSDSLRVFGNEVPPRAALHPLALEGPSWYTYRLADSVRLTTPQGRRVQLLGVEVIPRRSGPSLVAGRLWLDADGADLVRLSFRFVGTELWLDSDDDDHAGSARENRLISRLLTLDADLEYALQEDRYWMPYRQVVSGRLELPWFGDLVIPFRATTTFEDYQLNAGRPVVFTVQLPREVTDPDSVQALLRARRDSLREERRRRRRAGEDPPEDNQARDDAGRWANGRYEIHRPPAESLAAYAMWGDSLALADDPAADREWRELQSDLERMAVGLPGELTGRRSHGFAWERVIDAFRYNRVQGLAPGLGYQWVLPGDGFTSLRADARFGLSDQRVTGGLTAVREAPGPRWTLGGFRDLRSNDPYGRASTFGNSLNAVFAGHDDGDYHLTHGARLTREGSLGLGMELTVSAGVEDHRSVRRAARSWLNDALGGTGRFPANPPIEGGTYASLAARLEYADLGWRWHLGADALGREGRATVRAYGGASRPLARAGGWMTIALRAGIASADPLPQQAFRVGGSGSVGGFDYGAQRGQAFWAARLDWSLNRRLAQPVLFLDAGRAARASDLLRGPVLAGGGAGVLFLGGLLRVELSHPISDGGSGFRFDLGSRTVF
jgi:hypothetical protein